MSIAPYIKEIGRGKDGARSLSRVQATDLFGQVLDGAVTDLEVGAFCLAMRIKGETADEMAGFLDATHARMNRLPASAGQPVIVLPSYNGARKLPLLTPLLALLLAQRGLPVLMHGTATEAARVKLPDVLAELGIAPLTAPRAIADGEAVYIDTAPLLPGLKRLLDVRRTVGLRNPAHSLVKLMTPCEGPAVLVGSYTHPEYAISMAEVWERMEATALLLRGTEGEVVADARRMPRMEAFVAGRRLLVQEAQAGSVIGAPELPEDIDAAATARHVRAVLEGRARTPAPIARQVELLLDLAGGRIASTTPAPGASVAA